VVKNVKITGQKKWVAQYQGEQRGPFATQEEAAETAAEMADCDVKDLWRRKKYSKAEAAERFQLFTQMYDDGSAVPGDMEAVMQHAGKSKQMFQEEPAIEWLSIWAKYGPFKDQLLDCFKKTWGSGSRVSGSRVLKSHLKGKASRPERLWQLLKDTVIASHKSKADFNEWVKNCGRNVSHHSGFVATLMRFNMLEKAPDDCPKTQRLRLSSSTEEYRLLDSGADKAAALSSLEKLCSLADAVNDALVTTSTPRSCTEWVTYFNMIQEAIPQGPVTSLGFMVLGSVEEFRVHDSGFSLSPGCFQGQSPSPRSWRSGQGKEQAGGPCNQAGLHTCLDVPRPHREPHAREEDQALGR